MSQIKLDYSFMMSDWMGEGGISQDELSNKKAGLAEILAKIKRQKETGGLGFMKLLNENPQETENLARETRERFANLVVCGIGGSVLGARTIENALGAKNDRRLIFTGDTTDPNEIQDLTGAIDIKNTAFNIISKSGSTIETASFFLFLWNLVEKQVGKEKVREHFILTTDPQKGPLREIATSLNIPSLPVPQDVEGRYSVLSPVGLYPAAFSGVDIKKLLEGAREEDIEQNEEEGKARSLTFALLQHLSYEKKRSISIIFPYSKNLNQLGLWFRQLWAESLGKAKDVFGNSVHFGMTPILAIGPTDQHSQLQLYIEGPNDKVITFLRVEEPEVDFEIPKTDFKHFSYLSGHKFGELLKKEQEATALSLVRNRKPSQTLIVKTLDEKSLGAFFYFFEMAVLYLSAIAQVNPFDQPAVEEGKNIIYSSLDKKGYEPKRKEIETFKKDKATFII